MCDSAIYLLLIVFQSVCIGVVSAYVIVGSIGVFYWLRDSWSARKIKQREARELAELNEVLSAWDKYP